MLFVRSGGSGPASRRVLEDAFRARVMDELSAGDQPLLHGHLAPRAQAVWEIGGGCFKTGAHGLGIVHERQESCQPIVQDRFAKIFSSPARR